MCTRRSGTFRGHTSRRFCNQRRRRRWFHLAHKRCKHRPLLSRTFQQGILQRPGGRPSASFRLEQSCRNWHCPCQSTVRHCYTQYTMSRHLPWTPCRRCNLRKQFLRQASSPRPFSFPLHKSCKLSSQVRRRCSFFHFHREDKHWHFQLSMIPRRSSRHFCDLTSASSQLGLSYKPLARPRLSTRHYHHNGVFFLPRKRSRPRIGFGYRESILSLQ
mmetsp:Transcript_5752/g.10432  ORF Transcript_5752/g.10432 Transcript_5752/m.10432 type:complete len:216 (+) Transcript_5752:2600-3247(+)